MDEEGGYGVSTVGKYWMKNVDVIAGSENLIYRTDQAIESRIEKFHLNKNPSKWTQEQLSDLKAIIQRHHEDKNYQALDRYQKYDFVSNVFKDFKEAHPEKCKNPNEGLIKSKIYSLIDQYIKDTDSERWSKTQNALLEKLIKMSDQENRYGKLNYNQRGVFISNIATKFKAQCTESFTEELLANKITDKIQEYLESPDSIVWTSDQDIFLKDCIAKANEKKPFEELHHNGVVSFISSIEKSFQEKYGHVFKDMFIKKSALTIKRLVRNKVCLEIDKYLSESSKQK